jgi:Family of unknown function (DUF6291)
MRDSFILYRSFYEAICDLDSDSQAQVFKAICEYSLNFKEIELSGIAKTIFKLIKPQLDANNKRFENGSKPKSTQKESKIEANNKQNESKTKANNNVNDNVNDNHNKNENKNNNENHIFDFKKSLISLGVNETLVKDWLVVRKTKKASNTETALNSFLKEVKISGLEVSKVIEMCVYKSWVGFEAKWLTKEEQKKPLKQNVSNAEFFANMSPEEKAKWF